MVNDDDDDYGYYDYDYEYNLRTTSITFHVLNSAQKLVREHFHAQRLM